MSIYFDPPDKWVPYKDEPLICAKCASPNTLRVKRGEPKRDALLCLECDHITDRWNRTKGVI